MESVPDLPSEVWSLIGQHLSYEDYMRLAQTNKALYKMLPETGIRAVSTQEQLNAVLANPDSTIRYILVLPNPKAQYLSVKVEPASGATIVATAPIRSSGPAHAAYVFVHDAAFEAVGTAYIRAQGTAHGTATDNAQVITSATGPISVSGDTYTLIADGASRVEASERAIVVAHTGTVIATGSQVQIYALRGAVTVNADDPSRVVWRDDDDIFAWLQFPDRREKVWQEHVEALAKQEENTAQEDLSGLPEDAHDSDTDEDLGKMGQVD